MKKTNLYALIFLLLSFLSLPAAVFAVDSQDEAPVMLENRIEAMDKRLEKIQTDQEQVLENQKKILDDLQHLKVLVRRS